jgi:hypothetical protein
VIENFTPQPYPLFANYRMRERQHEPITARVIGWRGRGDGSIAAVLCWGASSRAIRPNDHVEFYDTLAEAEQNAEVFAEVSRQLDEEDAAGRSPADLPG